jgi:hypothetical protein
MLEKMLVEETPGKVMTWLCTAMASLAFLFVVSATNASFTGSPVAVPNPVNPQKVVAVLDYTAAGYTHFLNANLFTPVEQSYAIASDNISWIAGNAAYAMGIDQTSGSTPVMVSRVAGAHIVAPKTPPVTPAKTSQTPQGVFSPILAILTE